MKKYLNRILILAFLLGSVLVTSCRDRNKAAVVTDISLKVVRYEKELMAIDIYNIADSVSRLSKKYPKFTALFTSRIIEVGDTVQPMFGAHISSFMTDQSIYNLHMRVADVFADFDAELISLKAGFNSCRKFFPEKAVPTVYTYVSGLNQSIVIADTILGISLDKYLGVNEPIYNTVYPPIPNYLKSTMQREYIAPEAIRAWLLTEGNVLQRSGNFLTQVLNEARAVYITKQLLVLDDTLLWGFTPEQLVFCQSNEKQMWAYLIENKLLFSTDNFRISQFINSGPFTKDFSTDSPARAAVWLGYQIIESYMQRNKEVSLSELLAETDFQKILNEARYNP
jgi:hypothetical protein